MTNRFIAFAFIVLFSLATAAQTKDYTKWVNPFIGTGGHGHTFPGATMPFGMVQISPDTRTDNWDGSSGYHYSDDIIYGFSHTHLSGTGIPDGCDILFMPTIGEADFEAPTHPSSDNGYASSFSHSNEMASPGYYSVKLDDDNIRAELTTTARVGFHRYTFPGATDANVIIDLRWRDRVLDSTIQAMSPNRLEGYRKSASWAKDQTVYFVAEFSKPLKSVTLQRTSGNVHRVKITPDGKWAGQSEELRGNDLKAAYTLSTKPGEQILLKVAISYVSIEGARKNLEAEIPGWDFDKVRADAKAAWNKELSKIEVSGGTDAQTTTFYSALYHTMIHPNVFSDIDGQYNGHDGKIHQLPRINGPDREASPSQYTVFSLWDTFRAAHPLYTIIDQRRTVDFINTFIRIYEQGGRLPVWELWGEETDTMIGYHAVSVIADAMAKGIKGFDYEKAYAASKHSAELDHFGLAAYKKRGYISMEDEHESVSKTLEYAYNDWCIAEMAKLLRSNRVAELREKKIGQAAVEESIWNDKNINNLKADYEKYSARAGYFENLFDPETGFMRPKKNGGFVTPFAPNEVTFNFTEGNSWVYSFFVPHDVPRLMELMGGKEKFAAKLDELFNTKDKLTGREQPDITGLIGQYAHGNEPSHHIAYLYNYAEQPWKTQRLVRKIMDEFYKPEPDGLIGNEDCGQMSAWYILSASGFYPVTPGLPVYAIGTPLFKEVKYNLENGRTFTIKAPNVSARNIYIQSTKLNGLKHEKSSISHEDIDKGGTLEFEMTDAPVLKGYSMIPQFVRSPRPFPAVPIIEGGGRVFQNQTTITLKAIDPGAEIIYSTGGNWNVYRRPFTIDRTTTITARAGVKVLPPEGPDADFGSLIKDESYIGGRIAEATFIKKPNDWTVKIDSKYNRQYTGGGDEGLIDGIRGSLNFASGEWQGYQGQDFVATIDLQKATLIKEVGGGFLQDARPWIWMPKRIEFETSTDGVNFTRVAEIKTDVAPTDMKPQIRDLAAKLSPITARYVRVHAYNLGKIPSWHPGAGFEAFIFVDEIFIK